MPMDFQGPLHKSVFAPTSPFIYTDVRPSALCVVLCFNKKKEETVKRSDISDAPLSQS